MACCPKVTNHKNVVCVTVDSGSFSCCAPHLKEPTASDTENARAHRAVQKNDGLGKITLAKREKWKTYETLNCNGETIERKWQRIGDEVTKNSRRNWTKSAILKAGPWVAFAPEMIQPVIGNSSMAANARIRFLLTMPREIRHGKRKTGFTWFGKIAVVVGILRKKNTN